MRACAYIRVLAYVDCARVCVCVCAGRRENADEVLTNLQLVFALT